MLMHNRVEAPERKGAAGAVPASGVRACMSTDTKRLVPPICFPLSQGAVEELQLRWGQCQRGPKSSLVAKIVTLRGPGRWE